MFPPNSVYDKFHTIKRSKTQTIRIPIGSALSTEAFFEAEYSHFKIHCEDVAGIPALATIQPQVGLVSSYDTKGDVISLVKPATGFDWGVALKTGTARMRIRLSAPATAEVVFSITAYALVEGHGLGAQPVAGPEIQVTGNFDFGQTTIGNPIDEIFTITNIGEQDLILTLPITVPVGFTVTVDPSTTLLTPGASTSFTIEADAIVDEVLTGDASIPNNSPIDPYEFEITVEVLP